MILSKIMVSNETLTPADLIRPLSPEALEYFANGSIPVLDHELPLNGKFIRLGEIILVGTTIHYGRLDSMGRRPSLLHRDMLDYLLENDEALGLPLVDPGSEPQIEGVLHDAGTTRIRVDEDSHPVSLLLSRESFEFGRAGLGGRKRTAEIAQKLVGDKVEVLSIEC